MAYLNKYWPKIKKSIEFMIEHDAGKIGKPDGILEGGQYNTLDRMWYGKIAWTSSIYNAAVQAGAVMAHEMGDKPFVKQCEKIVKSGSKKMTDQLFNGEYFINIPDPDNQRAPNTYLGCHIDQILGQSWALQVGLPRILPFQESFSATTTMRILELIWTRRDQECTFLCSSGGIGNRYLLFPKRGYQKVPGKVKNDWEKLSVGYFSECMTGFTYQAAGHMIAEGLVEEGMTMVKAIHDRYAPIKRNPYNELEYGNHYTRAMSSIGAFVAASGFTLHEPERRIGFDPKVNPDDYKSAFITGSAWGTFYQKRIDDTQRNSLTMAYGSLRLSQINICGKDKNKSLVHLKLNGQGIDAQLRHQGIEYTIVWKGSDLKAGDKLEIELK